MDREYPDGAAGDMAELDATLRELGGTLDNILKVHSLNPNALRALMSFYKGVMHGDCAISLRRREMIAVTVSAVNDCFY